MSWEVFDRKADRYDAWFDSPEGSAIFSAEVECLRRLLPSDPSGWAEVGVGTGRFAAALDIPRGIDPSVPMLLKARERGIRTQQGRAEDLPYRTDSLAGILMTVTLCFLDNPESALIECRRVLEPGGKLVQGIVPAESSWGRHYQEEAEAGHPFYSVSRFYTCQETIELAEAAGFEFEEAASTLPRAPGEDLSEIPVMNGIVDGSGFVSIRFSADTRERTLL
ncbi:MAG: methyltransferase domain-containing protein [Planctomycetota bacterium]